LKQEWEQVIKTIRIFNFQSHPTTTLNLSPGVNYIVGPSDSGKSAIIRALRWLWTNRPLGSAFVSSFSEKGDCLVTVETNDFTIVRSQTKSKNIYQANDQEYKSFGQNPPQAVLDLLQWDVVNLQHQREQGFLLSEPPTKVSAYLNSLVGLDVVDSAVKKITSSIRSLTAQEKAKNEQCQELETRLSTFPDLDLAEQWINEANRLKNLISGSSKRADWIVEKAEEARKQFELIEFNDLLLQRINYNKLIEAEGKLRLLHNRFETLSRLQDILTETLSTLTKKVPDKIDGSLLFETENRWRDLTILQNLNNDQLTAVATLKSLCQQIEQLDKEFSDKFPEICPLCGQPILVKQEC